MEITARYTNASETLIAATLDGVEWHGVRLDADTDVSRSVFEWVQAGGVIVPYQSPPAEIPMMVSPYQARVALLNAGHLPAVDAIMADPSTEQAAKIAWEYATVFERHSPFIASLAPAIGLTDAQIDDLFVAASQVT